MQRWAARPSTSGQRSRDPQTVHHRQYSAGGKELTSHFESSLTNIQKALAAVEGSIRAGNPTPYFGGSGSETP